MVFSTELTKVLWLFCIMSSIQRNVGEHTGDNCEMWTHATFVSIIFFHVRATRRRRRRHALRVVAGAGAGTSSMARRTYS